MRQPLLSLQQHQRGHLKHSRSSEMLDSLLRRYQDPGRRSGKKWTNDKHYRIPYSQKVKGLVDLFAAWDPHNERIYYRFYDWKNAYILIDYFEWLLNTIFHKEDIYIILDGWSVHKSYAVKTFAALNPRLHLVPLPSCSSWMNAIERIFRESR